MIHEYENTLRTIIILILGSDDNVDYGVTDDRIAKWKEKREIEEKKYKEVLLEPRIIYYSDFYDLKNIIVKKWDLIKPILIDKKRWLYSNHRVIYTKFNFAKVSYSSADW